MSGYQVFTLGDSYTLPNGMTIQSIKLPDSAVLQGGFVGYSAKGSELAEQVKFWGEPARKKLEKAVEFITTEVSNDHDFKSSRLLGNVDTHSLENGAFEIPLGGNARVGGIPIQNPPGFLITEFWDSDHGGKTDAKVFNRLKYQQGLSYKNFKNTQAAANLPFEVVDTQALEKVAETPNYHLHAERFYNNIREALSMDTPEARTDRLKSVIEAWGNESADVLKGMEKELVSVIDNAKAKGDAALNFKQVKGALRTAAGTGKKFSNMVSEFFSQHIRKGLLAVSIATATVAPSAAQAQPLPLEGENQPRVMHVEESVKRAPTSAQAPAPVQTPTQAPAQAPVRTPTQTPPRTPQPTGNTSGSPPTGNGAPPPSPVRPAEKPTPAPTPGRKVPNGVHLQTNEGSGTTSSTQGSPSSQQVPSAAGLNADFEQRRVAPQAAIDKAKGGYDSPSRPVLPDNPMGARSVDKTQSSHHDAKGRVMSETTHVDTVSRRGKAFNFNTTEGTTYYDKKGRPIQRNLNSTHKQGSLDGMKVLAETDSVSRPNGMTWSRTVDSQNGMTTFREANGTAHTEWTFNREGQLVSTLSCSPEKTSEVRYQVDAQGRLVGATEKTTVVTPNGEQVSQVQRKASEVNIPKPSTPTDTPPSRLSPEAKSAFKSIGNFAGRAGIIWAASKYGEATRDTGPIPESNGGRLIGQYSDELTKSKQKAFAYLGAAGMTAAVGGIALTAGGKAAAKVIGKNAAKMGVKAIPVIGTVIGLGMAANRAVHGDFEGAGMEIAGAAVDFIPGYGQAASIAIDSSLAVRDARMKEGVCAFGAVDANGKPITFKDENGQEMQAVGTEIAFKNGQKEGPAKWYAFNEKGEPYVALIGAYKDDKQTGEWVRMDEQGNPVGRMHFEDGKPSGDLLYTDRKGNLIAKGNLTNGEYVEYYTDEQGNATEQVKQKGQFAKGYPAGKWDTYYPNGQQQTEFDYGKKTYKTYEMSTDPKQPQQVKQEGSFVGDRVLKAYIPEKDPKAPEWSDANYRATGLVDPDQMRDSSHRFSAGVVNNTVFRMDMPVVSISQPASSVGLSNPASSGGISGRLSRVAPAAPRIPGQNQGQSGQSSAPQSRPVRDGGR